MARRRRGKHEEEHENHERWLVSYADFITLLFAFFVVMYSISSVNEGKYRVLSDSIFSAFTTTKRSLEPIQVGEIVRSPLTPLDQVLTVNEKPLNHIAPLLLTAKAMSDQEEENKVKQGGASSETDKEKLLDEHTAQKLKAAQEEIGKVADNVENELSDLIAEDMVKVSRNKFSLDVEIKSQVLFVSGSSELLAVSESTLTKLARIFSALPNNVRVEGFTDNQPISTTRFPSNWELSAARAASVVRLFEANGLDPGRMAAVGYGEHRAVADNSVPEGRAKNRRVVVVVVASQAGGESDQVHEIGSL